MTMRGLPSTAETRKKKLSGKTRDNRKTFSAVGGHFQGGRPGGHFTRRQRVD